MKDTKAKKARRTRRHYHIRSRVHGAPERARLVVFRSLKSIYVQVVDDTVGRTLVAADSRCDEIQEGNKTAAARAVGKLVAERALAAGIKKVAFDRAGYKFHGRVKALAEAARKAGLEF